jgi:hypothetical protein
MQVLLPVTLARQQQQETVAMIFDTGTSSPYTWGFNWHQGSSSSNNNSSEGHMDAAAVLSGLDLSATAISTITGNSSSSSSTYEASNYYYETATTTIGSTTSQDFMFLVPKVLDNEAKLLSKGGVYGFAPGGYTAPGAQADPPASEVLSTWKQLSASAGLSGMTDRFGLWLSNDQKLLGGAATAFAGEISVGQLNPDRYTGTGVWVPVEPANATIRTDVKDGQLVSFKGCIPDHWICRAATNT